MLATNTGTSHVNGKLCVGGDWACAHGDLDGLRYVARCLADRTAGRLRHELLELADACHGNPEQAVATWVRLEKRVRRAR